MTTPTGLSLTIPEPLSSKKLQRKAEEQAAAAAAATAHLGRGAVVVDTVAAAGASARRTARRTLPAARGADAADGSLPSRHAEQLRSAAAHRRRRRPREHSTNRPLAAPKGLALLADGVLVCDSGYNKLLRLDWRDGSVAPYAGGGKRGHRDGGGAAAAFDSPAGVCVCSDSVVLVADTNNHCVRSVSCDGGGGRLVVRTVAGSGERGHRDALAGGAKFDRPTAVASSTSEGLIYVSTAATTASASCRRRRRAASSARSPAPPAPAATARSLSRCSRRPPASRCSPTAASPSPTRATTARIDFAAQEAYTLGGSTARRWSWKRRRAPRSSPRRAHSPSVARASVGRGLRQSPRPPRPPRRL